jgi:hypothetical protein
VAFTIDMAIAARRNLDAALKLEAERKHMVAGYLFGIAAECALKAMMVRLRLPNSTKRDDDPRFAHFPDLRILLRDQMSGRGSAPLQKFIHDQNFFSGWSILIRYSDGKSFDDARVRSWSKQARDIVGLIGA